MVAAFCAGCGEGTDRTYFSVAVEAKWPVSPATVDGLGYVITVGVVQRQKKVGTDGTCAPLPASTRVAINGYATDLTADATTGCMWGGLNLGPFLQDQSVAVVVEEGGQVAATAFFDHLTPGTAAALLGPSELHAGDDIVIRPVPEVPAEAGHAAFYLLDEPVWQPWGISGTTERRSDGLHVQVPAFTGRAVLTVWGTFSSVLEAEVSCPGFAVCSALSADALGPFFVTGVP
jgi:hypothetical protein